MLFLSVSYHFKGLDCIKVIMFMVCVTKLLTNENKSSCQLLSAAHLMAVFTCNLYLVFHFLKNCRIVERLFNQFHCFHH